MASGSSSRCPPALSHPPAERRTACLAARGGTSFALVESLRAVSIPARIPRLSSGSKLIGGIILNAAIFATLLFIPSGTVRWWRTWVLLAVVVVGAAASTLSLARIDQGLLEERFKAPVQKGQPLADKLVLVPLLTAFVASVVFVPLDVFVVIASLAVRRLETRACARNQRRRRIDARVRQNAGSTAD